MASIDVAKLLNKITQDIPGINTVLKALAKWDVSALTDVPDGAMQATTDANNNLTIKKKVSGSYTPVAKLMHDVDKLDGYHASTSATANAIAVRNSSGALPGNITGNAATADTATALAAGSVVPVNQGGTGATTASQARANLGVADGADFTTHVATQASPSVEGHVKLDALAADGSNTAAPGGFGLGKSDAGRRVTDLDTVLENGQFSFLPTATGLPSGWTAVGVGITYSHNANTKIQLIFGYLGSGELASYARSRFSTGTWGAWFILPHGITDSTATTSSTIAASATAVKTAFDRAKQIATASITGGIKVGGAISSVSSAGEVTLSSATTTSRGIARVATLADMEPGAVVENGPAVIDAKGGVITPTPTAHAVPQADANGKLDGWVSLAGKANNDLSNVDLTKANVVLQRVRYQTSVNATTQVTMPWDNTVPQITDGTQFMSINFTPRKADSRLVIDVLFNGTGYGGSGWHLIVAIFQDTIQDAIDSGVVHGTAATVTRNLPLSIEVPARSVAPRTYSVRAGCSAGGMGFNGHSAGVSDLGGTIHSHITVTEYAE